MQHFKSAVRDICLKFIDKYCNAHLWNQRHKSFIYTGNYLVYDYASNDRTTKGDRGKYVNEFLGNHTRKNNMQKKNQMKLVVFFFQRLYCVHEEIAQLTRIPITKYGGFVHRYRWCAIDHTPKFTPNNGFHAMNVANRNAKTICKKVVKRSSSLIKECEPFFFLLKFFFFFHPKINKLFWWKVIDQLKKRVAVGKLHWKQNTR